MCNKNVVFLLFTYTSAIVLATPINDKPLSPDDKYKNGVYFSVRKQKATDDPYKLANKYVSNEGDVTNSEVENKSNTNEYAQNPLKADAASSTNNQVLMDDQKTSVNQPAVQNPIPQPYVGHQPQDYQQPPANTYQQSQPYNTQVSNAYQLSTPQYQIQNQQAYQPSQQQPLQQNYQQQQQNMQFPTNQIQVPSNQLQTQQNLMILQPNQIGNQGQASVPQQSQQYILVNNRADIPQQNQQVLSNQQYQQPNYQQGVLLNQGNQQVVNQQLIPSQVLQTQSQPSSITLVNVPSYQLNDQQQKLQTQPLYNNQQPVANQAFITNAYNGQNQAIPQQLNVQNGATLVPVAFGNSNVAQIQQGTLIAIPVQQSNVVNGGLSSQGSVAVPMPNVQTQNVIPNNQVVAPAANPLSTEQQLASSPNQGNAVFTLVPLGGATGTQNTVNANAGNSQILVPVQQLASSQLIALNNGK